MRYFLLQRLVFRLHPVEEAHRHPRFFLHPLRREQIGIGQLVVTAAKVVDLDQPPVDECLQAIVDFTQRQAQLAGQFTLADLGARSISLSKR